jgi:hypothetical protein
MIINPITALLMYCFALSACRRISTRRHPQESCVEKIQKKKNTEKTKNNVDKRTNNRFWSAASRVNTSVCCDGINIRTTCLRANQKDSGSQASSSAKAPMSPLPPLHRDVVVKAS